MRGTLWTVLVITVGTLAIKGMEFFLENPGFMVSLLVIGGGALFFLAQEKKDR